MKVYLAEDYQEMSRFAANLIASRVALRPDCVLGLATGSTPIGTYQLLVEQHKKGELDFSRIKTVNLDEYVGLDGNHDQSYRYFMQKNLFDHINIDPANTHVPNGMAQDLAAECTRYDDMIQEMGGIELQILGIGHNGHIGFNEPDDVVPMDTHVVDLKESTIQANSRFFASAADVPKQAVTMGIGTIMSARQIVIMASGEDKADIIKTAFTGPVVPQVPASLLRLRSDLILVGDRAALSKLKP